MPLGPARWVIDPDFDLDYHFRRISLPGPGSFRQLLDHAAVLHASPLDLDRPLWEVTLIEGLNNGESKAALCWKFSHSVTDGVGGMVMDQMIHQSERDLDQGAMPHVPVPEDVSSMDLALRGIKGLPLNLVRGAAGAALGAVRAARQTLSSPIQSASVAAKTLGELRKLGAPPLAPPSPLLTGRGLERRYIAIDRPFADLRAVAKAHECSVNDVYLAALAGGLRRYHERMGMPIDALGLIMPVSIRQSATQGAGNQWVAVAVRLPIAETDVVRRMKKIRAQVLNARESTTLDLANLIAPFVTWIPQALITGLGPAPGNLGFDVHVSNVPGSASDRYIAGAKITRSVPLGPLSVAMMITMASFGGRCFVGVNYDTAAVTDNEVFESSMEAGFDEVLSAGGTKKASRSAKSPKTEPRDRL